MPSPHDLMHLGSLIYFFSFFLFIFLDNRSALWLRVSRCSRGNLICCAPSSSPFRLLLRFYYFVSSVVGSLELGSGGMTGLLSSATYALFVFLRDFLLLILISGNRRGMGHHDPLVYAIQRKDTSSKLTQYQGFREDSAYTQPTSRAHPLKMQTRQPRNSSSSSNTSTLLPSFSPRFPS